MSTAIPLPSTLSFGDLLSYGWQVLRTHFTFLLKMVLVMILLAGVPQFLINLFAEQAPGFASLLGIVLAIWQSILSIGMIRMVFELLRTGKEPSITIERYTEGTDVIVNYFLAQILMGVIVVIGLILFVVPGLYFMVKYMFVPYLIADKKLGIGEAFRMSGQMTEGKKLNLFIYMIGFIFFSMLGLLALVVGVVLTASITALAWAGMYLILEKEIGKVKTA